MRSFMSKATPSARAAVDDLRERIGKRHLAPLDAMPGMIGVGVIRAEDRGENVSKSMLLADANRRPA